MPAPSADCHHRVVVIAGSPRAASYTARAAALATDALRAAGAQTDAFDASALTLAMPGAPATPDANRLADAVRQADAILLATPEYHGSYSAAIKLVIENLGFPSVLAGKPVALLGVAAGRIGAIKALEHLRSVCSHVGALVLPGPISIAGVQQAFADDGSVRDDAAAKAIRGLATSLLEHLDTHLAPRRALESLVREGLVPADRAPGLNA